MTHPLAARGRPAQGPAALGPAALGPAALGAAILAIWAAQAGAATLSPSLSNCHPDCDMGELIAPLDAAPLETAPIDTPTPPGALSPVGPSLLEDLNELLGPPVDIGDLPQPEAPSLELEIPPVEGTIR
ncbi:MAG: hypothetical protein AAGC86_16340 [Pseudomonadota bacterium]